MDIEFQFLIGRLGTQRVLLPYARKREFQFLIGRLGTCYDILFCCYSHIGFNSL